MYEKKPSSDYFIGIVIINKYFMFLFQWETFTLNDQYCMWGINHITLSYIKSKNNITMKINVYATESYTTWLVREPVEIDTDNYPELEGKTEEEVKEYIRENYWEMKPTDEKWFGDLSEELNQMDIRRDKIYNEEMGIIFDNE